MSANQTFTWFHVVDGVAIPVEDTREVSALVNADGRNWYGNIEGAIINGGVLATAFVRKTEKLYDAAAFFRTGQLIPAGERTTTKITAQPRQHICEQQAPSRQHIRRQWEIGT